MEVVQDGAAGGWYCYWTGVAAALCYCKALSLYLDFSTRGLSALWPTARRLASVGYRKALCTYYQAFALNEASVFVS